jgi:hypothetical protein
MTTTRIGHDVHRLALSLGLLLGLGATAPAAEFTMKLSS